MIHVYNVDQITQHDTSPCVGGGEVSRIISSDTPLCSKFSDKRFPLSGRVQTSARHAAVPGLSSFGAGSRWPDRAAQAVTRVISPQSIADSQTCHSFQTPTRLVQTGINPVVICTFISWTSMDLPSLTRGGAIHQAAAPVAPWLSRVNRITQQWGHIIHLETEK